MIKTAILFCAALLLPVACATTATNPINNSSLTKVENLNLGATQAQAKEALGEPSEVSVEGQDTKWIYKIRYESKHGVIYLPEITLNFNSDNKLESKDFNLFQTEMSIKASDMKDRYKNNNFEMRYPSDWGKTHSFSSMRYLVDKKAGISIEYNTSRKDEVDSIFWYTPSSADSQITPAKN